VIERLLFLVIVLSLFSIGLLLVIGTWRGWGPLVRPPNSWFFFYPYGLLKRLFGQGAIVYLHIFAGIVFIVGSIWMAVYVIFLSR